MGKRYYCDYCERTFIDDIQARRKHLLGLKHNLRVKQHYDSFKDSKTILAEELAKTPCHKFQRTGDCSFGLNCRHSHMTPEKINELTQEVHRIEEGERLKKMEEERKLAEKLSQDPGLPAWLLKKKCRVKSLAESVSEESTEAQEEDVDDIAGFEDSVLTTILLGNNYHSSNTSYQSMISHRQLPPSLRPMSVDDLMNATWEDWG